MLHQTPMGWLAVWRCAAVWWGHGAVRGWNGVPRRAVLEVPSFFPLLLLATDCLLLCNSSFPCCLLPFYQQSLPFCLIVLQLGTFLLGLTVFLLKLLCAFLSQNGACKVCGVQIDTVFAKIKRVLHLPL